MGHAGKRESRHVSEIREFSGQKTRPYRDRLSDGPVNSNRPDFELDFKLRRQGFQGQLSYRN